jgi:hypothetical protein
LIFPNWSQEISLSETIDEKRMTIGRCKFTYWSRNNPYLRIDQNLFLRINDRREAKVS